MQNINSILVVLVWPRLKQELKKMLGIIQKKMKQKKNGRNSSLGLPKTMTALLPKFNNVTLVSDDSMPIETYKVIL